MQNTTHNLINTFMNILEFDVAIMNIHVCVVSGWGILHLLPMNIVKSQSNCM